jgi:hypothetical protein
MNSVLVAQNLAQISCDRNSLHRAKTCLRQLRRELGWESQRSGENLVHSSAQMYHLCLHSDEELVQCCWANSLQRPIRASDPPKHHNDNFLTATSSWMFEMSHVVDKGTHGKEVWTASQLQVRHMYANHDWSSVFFCQWWRQRNFS